MQQPEQVVEHVVERELLPALRARLGDPASCTASTARTSPARSATDLPIDRELMMNAAVSILDELVPVRTALSGPAAGVIATRPTTMPTGCWRP